MPVKLNTMTTNNTLRLLLLLLCLATIITTVSSCDKNIDKPVQDPGGYTMPDKPDYWFSRVRHYSDNRKPATDTIWTLHLITQELVDKYALQDGYIYAQTNSYLETGELWIKKK